MRLNAGDGLAAVVRQLAERLEREAAKTVLLTARDIRPAREVTDRALALVGHEVPFSIQLLADASSS